MEVNKGMLKELQEKVFVSPTEELKATLGNSYLKEIITNSKVGTGAILVTDKRVYFKGKVFKMSGKKLSSTYGGQVVDLKDVTGTGFQKTNPIWSLLLGIVLSILFIISISTMFTTIKFTLLGVPAISFTIFYFLTKKTLFEVNYAGGSICLNSSWYSKDEIHDFEKQLRRAKDLVSTPQVKETLAPIESSTKVESLDKVSKLKECKEMLEGGFISEDEFETLKKQILAE